MTMMITPHITEKTLQLATGKQFTFLVKGKFNKLTIAKFLKDHFNVHPLGVRTITKQGARFAIVKIKPDEKIDGFEIESKDKPIKNS